MDNAFTVLPMSQSVNLVAGQTTDITITVANPADAKADFRYAISVMPYAVVDADYTADFQTRSNRSQIVDWITIDESTGVIAPNGTKKITIRIDVPEDAPAGGQYAAIAVRSNNQGDNTGGVNIKSVFEMASIVFANVAGETVHSGEVVENYVPVFSMVNPVVTSYTIRNNGNVHEAAIATITVKDKFSGKMIFPSSPEDKNEYTEYIMPESTRYSTRSIDRLANLGVYEITQSVNYLGKPSVTTRTVIVCPLWFAILVLVTIGAIIGAIIRLIFKKIKRRRNLI